MTHDEHDGRQEFDPEAQAARDRGPDWGEWCAYQRFEELGDSGWRPFATRAEAEEYAAELRAHIEDEIRALPLAEVARRLAEIAVVVEARTPDAAE